MDYTSTSMVSRNTCRVHILTGLSFRTGGILACSFQNIDFIKHPSPLSPPSQFRFLKMRLPAAGSAITTFLFAVVGLRFKAVFAALAALATPRLAMPGLFCSVGLLAVAAGRPRLGFTTVVLVEVVEMSVFALWLLDWLIVRWGEAGPLSPGRGGGSIFPRVPVVAGFSLDVVLVILAAVPRFACSIMPCTLAEMADVAAVAADLNGLAGLRGETGLAMKLLAGEPGAIVYSLIGERGSVREL